MKIHKNGGGEVSDTATVDPSAFIGSDCKVLDNANVGAHCVVGSGAVIYGNASLTNKSSVVDGAKVGGTAFLAATNIHGDVVLEKTPITLHGFEQEIVISDTFIVVGCQTISMDDWQNRSIALLRANGYPKKSAERIRDSINVILDCYRSIYHEDDVKMAFKTS
jgi:carbonic anhydrase/acetyltransferase-like protein (isoleucine patch superfamily)